MVFTYCSAVAVEMEICGWNEDVFKIFPALQQPIISLLFNDVLNNDRPNRYDLIHVKCLLLSPQVEDSEGTIQFDGEGYALVSRPIRWYPNISTVMFKFRTFSSSALLMYLATRDLVKIMCIAEFP